MLKAKTWFIFLLGTVGPEKDGIFVPEVAVLFSLTKEKAANIQATEITVSNGLAWSSDNKYMYYIDSVPKTVDVFDYNMQEGIISKSLICFFLK